MLSRAIGRGIVRLGALAMPAGVEGDGAHALPLERAIPAQPLPVLGAVGGEAVDKDHRPALTGAGNIVIGKGQAPGSNVAMRPLSGEASAQPQAGLNFSATPSMQ